MSSLLLSLVVLLPLSLPQGHYHSFLEHPGMTLLATEVTLWWSKRVSLFGGESCSRCTTGASILLQGCFHKCTQLRAEQGRHNLS